MAAEPLGTLPEVALESRPLEYVSPSRAVALETCFLQAAFGTDPFYRELTFKGPKSLLGIVCHALVERASKGELASLPEVEARLRLEEMWSEEIAKAEAAAQRSMLTKHLSPARGWPGYALQRARAIRMAEALVRRRGVGGGHKAATSERSYRAYGGRMRGRADLVRSVSGRVEIEDYKTGEIYERSEINGPQTLKPRYRKQISFYAAMHHSETGEWPVVGRVVSLTGERESILIDPAEADREAEAALELLAQFNARVSEGLSPKALATPSKDACRLCNFKAYCEPFWTQASVSWDWGSSVTAEGYIRHIHDLKVGGWTAEVLNKRGNIDRGMYVVRGSRVMRLEAGQHFRAVNLMAQETEDYTTLSVTDYTEMWACSDM